MYIQADKRIAASAYTKFLSFEIVRIFRYKKTFKLIY